MDGFQNKSKPSTLLLASLRSRSRNNADGTTKETLAAAVFHRKTDRRAVATMAPTYILAYSRISRWQEYTPKRVHTATAKENQGKQPAVYDRILPSDSRSRCDTNFEPPRSHINTSMPQSTPEGGVVAAARASCYTVCLDHCLAGLRFAHHPPRWTGIFGGIPSKAALTRAAGPA